MKPPFVLKIVVSCWAGALLISTLSLSSAAEPVDSTGGHARFRRVVRLSGPGEDIQQVWGYADPTDARYLIACGMASHPQQNVTYGYVYSSTDGGVRWRRTLLDEASRWVSEESCTFGADGRAYFADGQSDVSTGMPRHQWGRLQLFTSNDRGVSWERAASSGFVDWTILAALPADGRHAPSVAIFGNKVVDHAGHWWPSQPVAMWGSDNGKVISAPAAPNAQSYASGNPRLAS